MVQVIEPSLLRRDLLETLREVILFMQSYEKFKRIQQEKVNSFSALKADLKELSLLLNTKMKGHFPKGKLQVITEVEEHAQMQKEHSLGEGEIRAEPVGMARQTRAPQTLPTMKARAADSHGELDALEGQLRDIEGQLKEI